MSNKLLKLKKKKEDKFFYLSKIKKLITRRWVGSEMSNEKKKENSDKFDIINQLKQDIKSNLESLKKDISVSLESSKTKISKISNIEEILKKSSKSFLDYFGSFPSLTPEMKNKVSIEKPNLISSITSYYKELDLEMLFLYVSILKMLEVNLVDNFLNHAFEVLKKHVNNAVFTASTTNVPDPQNTFYGLAILSEIGKLSTTEFIDLQQIVSYLQKELTYFNPNALYNNYFLLQSINLLKRKGIQVSGLDEITLQEFFTLDLSKLKNFNAITDTFYFTASLKLLNEDQHLQEIKAKHIQTIKDFISNIAMEHLTLTEISQLLLIIDLLNLKQSEDELIQDLAKRVHTTTNFFNADGANSDFYWKNDTTAYLIELSMLFWTLLAIYQYQA